jgi:hypothetical protein
MRKVNLCIIILLFIFTSYGQENFLQEVTFDKIRGQSDIKIINTFANGDLALVGENTPVNSEKKNIFVLRSDSKGNIIWIKEFSSDRILAVNDFLIDDSENIVIVAEQYEDGNRESLFLLGLDDAGTIIFSKHYNEAGGEIEAYDITNDKDGGFLITGFCKLPTLVSNVFFQMIKEEQFLYLLKVDSIGNKIWSKYIEEDYLSAAGKEIIIDKKSIVNIFSNNHKNNKENVIKLITSKDNDTFQEYILVTDKNAVLSDVAYDGNNFYLTGLLLNEKNDGDNYDIFLIKLNSEYQVTFSKIIKSDYNDWVTGVLLQNDNIILFGQINKKGSKKLYSLELEKDGTFLSFKTYNTPHQSITLMDGENTQEGFLFVGNHWKEKRVGMLLNADKLTYNDNEFKIINSNFLLQKSKLGEFRKLNKNETIEPVNLKELKY